MYIHEPAVACVHARQSGSWCALNLFVVMRLAQASGPCNLEMPNGPSVYQRYLWYLRLLTYNGFVVLADNHLNSDGTIVNTGVDTWVSVSSCILSVHINAGACSTGLCAV